MTLCGSNSWELCCSLVIFMSILSIALCAIYISNHETEYLIACVITSIIFISSFSICVYEFCECKKRFMKKGSDAIETTWLMNEKV